MAVGWSKEMQHIERYRYNGKTISRKVCSVMFPLLLWSHSGGQHATRLLNPPSSHANAVLLLSLALTAHWRGFHSHHIHPMFSRAGGTYGELILHKTSDMFWKITSNPPTSSEKHRICSMVLLIYMAPLGPMKKAMWKSFTKTILATYSRPSAYSLSDFSPGSAHCSGWPPGSLARFRRKKNCKK